MVVAKPQPIRMLALLCAMMASGGSLLIAREVWVVATIAFAIASLKLRINLNSSDQLIIFWIICVSALQLALEGYANPISLASRIATYIAAFLLLKMYVASGANALKTDLFAILSIFSFQGIITAILGNIAPSVFSVITINELLYYHIAFIFNFHYAHNIVTPMIRPNGLFYEPGVFQFYLSIFLYLSLFWKRDLRWGFVALIALLTTISTVGAIIAAVQVVAFFMSYMSRARGPKLIVGIFVVPVIVIATLLFAVENVNDKMSGDGRGSALAREFDLRAGLSIVAQAPIFGIGFSADAFKARSQNLTNLVEGLPVYVVEERVNSNGLIQIPVSIGIPLSLPIFFGIFRQRFFKRRLIFASIVLFTLIGQSLSFSVFFLFIFFSGMLLNQRRMPSHTWRGLHAL